MVCSFLVLLKKERIIIVFLAWISVDFRNFMDIIRNKLSNVMNRISILIHFGSDEESFVCGHFE